MLGTRAIARYKHYDATVARQQEEQVRRQQEVEHAPSTSTLSNNWVTDCWKWIKGSIENGIDNPASQPIQVKDNTVQPTESTSNTGDGDRSESQVSIETKGKQGIAPMRVLSSGSVRDHTFVCNGVDENIDIGFADKEDKGVTTCNGNMEDSDISAASGFGGEETYSKHLLYVWSGTVNATTNDYLAVLDITNGPNFGTLITKTPVPTSGNEPHHLGMSTDGTRILAGGLLSLLHGQGCLFLFDTTHKRLPKFIKSINPNNSANPDDVIALSDGRFLITMMGSKSGGTPGAVIVTDKNLNSYIEYPTSDQAVNLNLTGFNPHGIDISKNHFVVGDFVDPASTLVGHGPPQFRNTVRVWDLKTLAMLKTLPLGKAKGVMDTVNIPGTDLFYATAMENADIYLINAANLTSQFVYSFNVPNSLACIMTITKKGNYLFTTVTGNGGVYMTDVSDPYRPKPIANYTFSSPHYVSLTPDEKRIVVVDYFLQEGPGGVVNVEADFKIHVGDITPTGINFNRVIDYQGILPGHVSKPHGIIPFSF
ncbi:hypothetical protein HDU76_007656 [Blyttiomyces sp. JEL0837]|nr:hypothetical protein HDU76_007656 [Blyttiomyces sp. JEL0837]